MKWTNKGHELDHVGKKFEGRQKVYIYGSKQPAEDVFKYLDFLNCVQGFIDGNLEIRKEKLCGKPIYGIENIDLSKKDFIIVVASQAEAAMIARCVDHGLEEGRDFFLSNTFIRYYLPIYAMYAHGKSVIRLFPQSLTEVCTLRCIHCNHSLPFIGDPVHFDAEEFKRDIDLFFKYVDFVYFIDFVGGELFTHPQMYEMVKYTLDNYSHRMRGSRFSTNGTIMPDEKTIALMKEYDIEISFTDYSINAPHVKEKGEKFLKVLEENNIRHTRDAMPIWKDYGIGRATPNLKSEAEKINYFNDCGTPCRYMRNGKFYYCTTDRLAQRAALTPEDSESYLDFNTLTNDDKMQILEFDYGYNNRGYLNLCLKCNRQFSINSNVIPKGIQYKEKGVLTLEKMNTLCKVEEEK